jgi:hypothetical protein
MERAATGFEMRAGVRLRRIHDSGTRPRGCCGRARHRRRARDDGDVRVWSAALALVSASPILPAVVRITGGVAAVLFAMTAIPIMTGATLTPHSEPLPFYAYPFLAFTLIGWAWAHWRSTSG